MSNHVEEEIISQPHQPVEAYKQYIRSTDWKEYRALFNGQEFMFSVFDKHISQLMDLMRHLGLDYETSFNFISRLCTIQFWGQEVLFTFLPRLITILSECAVCGVQLSQHSVNLLLDTIEIDDGEEINYYNYLQNKLLRVLVGHARGRAPVREEAAPGKSPNTSAEVFSERESAYLSARIVESLRSKTKLFGIGTRTSTIAVSPAQGGETKLVSEFFRSKQGIEFVRVGYIFFIDVRFRKYIPSEIRTAARNNIIYVPSMAESEFRNRLGYFTANTLASLMQCDMRGHLALDCGTGTGVLAHAAKRLGADVVLGVDYSHKSITQAHTSKKVNGYVESDEVVSFLEADLRDYEAVMSRVVDFAQRRPVTLISNIGYWLGKNDYPISNITSLFYLLRLRSAGIDVQNVVCGGYSYMSARFATGERRLLQELGLRIDKLPSIDQQANTYILKKMGFERAAYALSEELIQPGAFPRHVGSLMARSCR